MPAIKHVTNAGLIRNYATLPGRSIRRSWKYPRPNAFITLPANLESEDSHSGEGQNGTEANAQEELSGRARRFRRQSSIVRGKHIAVKDNICTVDSPTTCASDILQDFQSPFDATVVKTLKWLGADVSGKTNMDEFGMGTHSTHSNTGWVSSRGPDMNFNRSAGGSSGGSAVAVAEGLCWA
jgi:Asp-tRNA(Asn)/Glu-tRNA(Gln) amidotransferase A subunit family amidase